MFDMIAKFNSSIIQHGKHNNRIYLMHLDKHDHNDILSPLNLLANKYKYTKIFAKVPESIQDLFIDDGYIIEAIVPYFYNGQERCLFMSKFLNKERLQDDNNQAIQKVLNVALSKKGRAILPSLADNMTLRKLHSDDTRQMVQVYKSVFTSYPFPIHNVDYLKKTMRENIDYFGIFEDTKLFAVSSCEKDIQNKNAEMSDFAILPKYRGNNFSLLLLQKMQEEMSKQGYKLLYTIARAISYGINSTFSKHSFSYGGTLINNTNISGKIQSMNIWYKKI